MIPPPVDDPERSAAPFDDTLDETIDQSFPASDPPSTNPKPSYAADASDAASRVAAFGEPRVHLRHEGLVWAAAGALGAAASLRLIGDHRASRLLWQLAPAAVLAGAAFVLTQQYVRNRDDAEGC